MPPTNRTEFVRDFFFTDIMNHQEFLKWTGTLEKDDDILLVNILERLASDEPPAPIEPFYGSFVEHRSIPKNALHIAKAYAQIQRLAGHDFNIFEHAFLDPASYQFRAWSAFIIQIGFFSNLVIYNIFEEHIMISPSEDGFWMVVMILFFSSTLFFVEVRRQRNDAHDFNLVMRRLGHHSEETQRFWLHINYAINGILGICVFFFNIYFILVSDSPTDAVLNSVALAFIIEIDDVFQPSWNEENKEDALAEVLKKYVTEDEWPHDIRVVATGARYMLLDDLNLYVRIEDYSETLEGFRVYVFVADANDRKTKATVRYQKLEYEVTGPKSMELYEAFLEFHCLENFEDIINTGGHLTA